MALPLAPLSGISGIPGIAPIMGPEAAGAAGSSSAAAASGAGQAAASSPSGFSALIDQLGAAETQANTAAVSMATGGSVDIATYTTLAARSQLAVELASAVRNRAVDAFSEIMRMQV